jgi:hypothetical protein
MSNDNSLELTGSLARKRLLPSVSEVVRGLSAQVQADPAVVFRAARQVVADELIRVKQGFEAASADVLVTRARRILEGTGPEMSPTPPPAMGEPPAKPFVSTQPLPQISSNDPFVETTGGMDLRWDRDVRDPLAEPFRGAGSGGGAFDLPQSAPFATEITPAPVFEITPLGLPDSPPPSSPEPLWPEEPTAKEELAGLEKAAASVSLTDVLPPVSAGETGLPSSRDIAGLDVPVGPADVPYATEPFRAEFPASSPPPPPLSPGAADLPPGWLERDPMDVDVEAARAAAENEPEPEVEPPAPVFLEPMAETPSRMPLIAAAAAVLVIGGAAAWWFFLRPTPPASTPEPVKVAEQAPTKQVSVLPEVPATAPGEAPSVSMPPATVVGPEPTLAPTQPAAAEVQQTVPVAKATEPVARPEPTVRKPEPTTVVAAAPVKPAVPVATQPPAPSPVTVSQASTPSEPVRQTRAGTLATKDWAGKTPVFVLHFSSFQTKKQADSDSARIAKRIGVATQVVEVDLGEKGTWYRVVAGEFATSGEALEFRKKLEDEKTPGLGLVYKMVGRP